MAIPDYQSPMLPLLDFAADGREQPVFDNRVAWAKTYPQQAGLLSSPRRGHFQITERG